MTHSNLLCVRYGSNFTLHAKINLVENEEEVLVSENMERRNSSMELNNMPSTHEFIRQAFHGAVLLEEHQVWTYLGNSSLS